MRQTASAVAAAAGGGYRLAAAPGGLPLNRILLIQGLRAAAALAVVLHHLLHERYGGGGQLALAGLPWESGVDVFFVISGFVMVHASARLFATGGGGRRFLWRRLARIVPLYWAATTAFLALTLALPGAINSAPPGWGAVLASYGFLPWPRPDGLVQPVFSLGWTLNYEMFFYAVFALFLPLPRGRAVAGVAATLGTAVLLGWLWPPAWPAMAFWCDPIVLEFVAGMGLALLAARGLALPAAARWALALAGLALLVLLPPEWPRGLRFGPGATALVAAAALGPEPRLPPALATWLARLGDASYALYLVHPFALRAVALVALALPNVLAAALAVALALGIALASHRWFEAPLTRALTRR